MWGDVSLKFNLPFPSDSDAEPFVCVCCPVICLLLRNVHSDCGIICIYISCHSNLTTRHGLYLFLVYRWKSLPWLRAVKQLVQRHTVRLESRFKTQTCLLNMGKTNFFPIHIFIHWDPLCPTKLRYNCLNVIPTLVNFSEPPRIPADFQAGTSPGSSGSRAWLSRQWFSWEMVLRPVGTWVPMPHSTKHSHPAVAFVVLLTAAFEGEQRSGTYPSNTNSLQLHTAHSRSHSLLVFPMGTSPRLHHPWEFGY